MGDARLIESSFKLPIADLVVSGNIFHSRVYAGDAAFIEVGAQRKDNAGILSSRSIPEGTSPSSSIGTVDGRARSTLPLPSARFVLLNAFSPLSRYSESPSITTATYFDVMPGRGITAVYRVNERCVKGSSSCMSSEFRRLARLTACHYFAH